MLNRKSILTLLALTIVSCGWLGCATAGEHERSKELQGKTGTVTGVVTRKGDTWIEVRAEGEKESRRYTPHWRGGMPADGGGLDKAMLEKIHHTAVGSVVKLKWKYEERYRLEGLEVIKRGEGDGDKGAERKKDERREERGDREKRREHEREERKHEKPAF